MAKKTEQELGFKRTVLDYDDISKMVPYFKGKQKLVERLLKWLDVDKVNWIHDHNCDTPGVPFTAGLLRDLNLKLDIDNEGVGSVKVGYYKGGSLKIDNEGVGSVTAKVDCQSIDASLDGVGGVTLSGTTRTYSKRKDGVGGFHDKELKVLH